MSVLVKCIAVVLSLPLAVAVQSQEGFPLDGTWRGEWGPDGGKSTVVIVMKWDGKNALRSGALHLVVVVPPI